MSPFRGILSDHTIQHCSPLAGSVILVLHDASQSVVFLLLFHLLIACPPLDHKLHVCQDPQCLAQAGTKLALNLWGEGINNF